MKMKTAFFILAASLIAASSFGAGTTKFKKLKDNDTVVTNAWQAVKPNIMALQDDAQVALDESMVTFLYDVWACDHVIPAGQVSTMSQSIKDELKAVYGDWVLSETLASPMTSSMTYAFAVRTMARPDACDLSIDWGDGEITRVKDRTWVPGHNYYENASKNEIYYTFIHTYEENGVYTIRYIGKDWHAISHNVTKSTGSEIDSTDGSKNLVCRVFDLDCPVPSQVKNFSSMFVNGKKILKVNARYNYPVRYGNNCSTAFSGCANLIDAGYFFYKSTASTVASTYANCISLRTIGTPRIPAGEVDSIASLFSGCSKLNVKIEDIVVLPFRNNTVAAQSAFKNCSLMTGTVPANLLWEDTSIKWTPASLYLTNGVVNVDGPFYGCSDAIRAQVPPSWGGSNNSIKVPAYTGARNGGGSSSFVSTNSVLAVFDPSIITKLSADPKGDVDYAVSVQANKMTTIYPDTVSELIGTELAVESLGSRNFSLFLPNEESVRVGLPITIMGDGTNVVLRCVGGIGTNVVTTLPAKVDVSTPYSKITLLTINNVDDGYDWKPVITNSLYCPYSDNKFSCSNFTQAVQGYNLQCCTNFFLTYPTSATETRKFGVMQNATLQPKSGTFYNSFPASNIVALPASDLYWTDSGTKTWFEIEFHTTHGIGKYRQEYIKP